MQTVYIETTIPSYLAARPSSQPHIAFDQAATHQWWQQDRARFRLFTSAFTSDECSRGDASAAARRLAFLEGIPELPVLETLPPLERDMALLFQLPRRAYTDASHLALAILHKMDYLLTWNCTHLANAVLQKELVDYCNYTPCTSPLFALL